MLTKKLLIRLLSEHAGYDVSTPHGSGKLRHDIELSTGERLSLNTIKRITGVLPYDGTMRESTIEIIAQFLGFNSSTELRAAINVMVSDFVLPAGYIDVQSLSEGALIRLRWAPNRILKIKHISDGRCLIVEAKNSKLVEGDIIQLSVIAKGLPLMVKDVVRNGDDLGPYTAASECGLSELTML